MNSKKIEIKVLILILVLCLMLGWNLWTDKAIRNFYKRIKRDDNFYEPPSFDFATYYIGGKSFALGYNPYFDNISINPLLSNLVDPHKSLVQVYNYPPTLLPFFSLLANLEYDTARAYWIIIYFSVYLFACLILLFTIEKKFRIKFIIFASLLSLTSNPILFHILMGQIDLLIVGIVMLSFAAHSRKYQILSALLLAIATHIKVYPMLLLFYFVIYHKNYRYLIYFLSSVIIIFAISLSVIPFDWYIYNITEILPSLTTGDTHWHGQSLIKFVADKGILSQLISFGGFALFILFVWYLGKKRKSSSTHEKQCENNDTPINEIVFFLNILVILLFSGRIWHTVYVWTILPSALILTSLIKRTNSWYLGLIGLSIFLMNSNIFRFRKILASLNILNHISLLTSLNMFGNMLMFLCLTIYLTRQEWVIKKN